MHIKPMIFNAEMTDAIRANHKTVTRRVVKPQPPLVMQEENSPIWCGHFVSKTGKIMVDKPPYRTGDIIYVPEAWKCRKPPKYSNLGYEIVFRDGAITEFQFKENERFEKWRKYWDKPDRQWQSPYFMPREAARIFLRVTGIRVEKLQDITEEQALREGCKGVRCNHDFAEYIGGMFACTDCMNTGWLESPMVEFIQLWESTIKPTGRTLYGWDVNPWVWVITFEQISRGEAIADI